MEQGFDPVAHSLQELEEFCKRLEVAESMGPSHDDNNNNKSSNKRKRPHVHFTDNTKNDDVKPPPNAEATNRRDDKVAHKWHKPDGHAKWCAYHNSDTHDFSECKVMLAQAQKMRDAWNNRHPTQKHQIQKKKQEIHTILEEMVQKHLQTKNKKAKPNNHSSSDDDDESSSSTKSTRDENFTLDVVDEYINTKVIDAYPLAAIRNPIPLDTSQAIQLAPITIAHVQSRPNESRVHKLITLLDSGASGTIISYEHVKHLPLQRSHKSRWDTRAGVFTTSTKCKIRFSLPEFFENRIIEWPVHVDDCTDSHRYDLIIGRDLLKELGMSLDFSQHIVTWDNATITMKDVASVTQLHKNDHNSFYWQDDSAETEALKSSTERIKRILDAKYEKANLDELVRECSYLTEDQQIKLLKLLRKHEYLFDGTLGRWDSEPYTIELKPDATPYHARAFPIPKINEATLRLELDRLCNLGVLRKINHSEWAAPTFIIPKKDGSVRFISDFRELNKRIKRKPYPIPHIQDLLHKLEGFMYATSLDLNMGYYHIVLSPFSRQLCTIVTPWGKYEYLRLPMGLCNSPDIFQERMSELMSGLDYVRAYIDDVLITTCSDWDDHLDKLDTVFTRLGAVGLKVNAKKSFFGRNATEYLGFWITRQGISPVPKKVDALLKIAPPTTRKQLRRFIGMVNYYRDMWIRRSHTLAPLTALTSKNVKWHWTSVEQNAFDAMKKIISRETLLTYPNFNLPFEIHTDASHSQLGAVISQQGRPIAFYSRKLNPAQTRYTTTERELLSIVETLKEFRNILLGQQITIYTDHQNLTHKNFNTERVMRWRLIIEEFGPTFVYIKGSTNIVADALSRLDLNDTPPLEVQSLTLMDYSDLFGKDLDDIPTDIYPLEYRVLDDFQQRDPSLLKLFKHNSPGYHVKAFRGGGTTRMLICYNDKIVVPMQLRQRVLNWYHMMLCHPGMNRTEESIRQHLWWPNIRDDVVKYISTCTICQRNKKQRKKYGYMPEKEAEADPWDKLCVDLIGPYTIKRKGKPDLKIKCVTMIDPATSWFEIAQYDDKRAITIANIVEQQWLTRYPLPTQIIFDRGSEFMGHEFINMITKDYGIKKKPISVRNPQANAVLERVHQTIGNIVRTFELENNYLNEEDPWSGILSATAFAIRSTYHTTLKASPGQLVFGRDMMFNIKHVANWHAIKLQKQKMIQKNNQKENKARYPYQYRVGEKVLLLRDQPNKYERPYEGPYEIKEVKTNGTVRLQMGAVLDTVNIRRLQPYKEAPDANRGGECNRRQNKRRRLN